MLRNARPTTWHGTNDCGKGWRIFGHSSLEHWLDSFNSIYKQGMKCNERFLWQCLFYVVHLKSIQTKHLIWFIFYLIISFMFMIVKMLIIKLDSCIFFATIHFARKIWMCWFFIIFDMVFASSKAGNLKSWRYIIQRIARWFERPTLLFELRPKQSSTVDNSRSLWQCINGLIN